MIAALRRHLEEMRREADCPRRGYHPSFVAAQRPGRLPGAVASRWRASWRARPAGACWRNRSIECDTPN